MHRFVPATIAWAAALGVGLGAAGACSLIATFEDRPGKQDAGAPDGGDADQSAPDSTASLAAFPLDTCDQGAVAKPLEPQPCNYRDESCSGFADLSERYEIKPNAPDLSAALACDRGALVAYEWSDGDAAEVRVLARVREGAASQCPDPSADAGTRAPETLMLFRFDATTLALVAQTQIEIDADLGADAGKPSASGVALGRSERRLVAAVKTAPDAKEVFVLSAAIDGEVAGAPDVDESFELALAARVPAPAAFVPAHVTAADADSPGRFYVAVEGASSTSQPLVTRADEGTPAEAPFGPVLKFADGTAITAVGAALFDRSQSTETDAGLTAARLPPGAIAPRSDGDKTLMSNDVGPQWMATLRYLVVPGFSTIGTVRPWYSAAPLVPDKPGAGFGTQPAHTRLDVWTAEGRTYAQLRACEIGASGPCTVTAKPDGGTGSIDPMAVPLCDDATPFNGALDSSPLPDAGYIPSLWATCRLANVVAGSGVLTWHRAAGAFGAVLSEDGTRVWIVRPEGAAVAGTDATLRLATTVSLAPGSELAGDGPVSVAFVDGAGWIVAAVERATGRLWARRFGCP